MPLFSGIWSVAQSFPGLVVWLYCNKTTYLESVSVTKGITEECLILSRTPVLVPQIPDDIKK